MYFPNNKYVIYMKLFILNYIYYIYEMNGLFINRKYMAKFKYVKL